MSDWAAIVLDIDGTLLDSRGRLSEANLCALRACTRQGILLYIATARPQRLVFRAREVPGDATFLTERGAFYNGAWAVDRLLNYVRHWPMPATVVQALVDDLVDVAPDLQIALQFADQYHSFRLPMDSASLANWGFSRKELLPFPEASQRQCSKIVALHQTLSLRDAYRDLRIRHAGSVNAFLTDDDRWLQLMSAQASKEHAIADLLAQRGIGLDLVIVFGDDLPDRGMFTTFGCPVAMGNAPDTLKEAAKHVTRSNDEDGIAFALREILRIL